MMPSTAKEAVRIALAAVATAMALSGCASKPAAPHVKSGELVQALSGENGRIPAPLIQFIQDDRAEGARNFVRNAMKAGKSALDINAPDKARAALSRAYQQIETIYANNPAAQEARKKFVPESHKEFKGEPYERAMVGYYLGLADLLSGDLDNARSSFAWGELQDSMSASENYQNDMVSLVFLKAWVDHCAGKFQAAQAQFNQARTNRTSLPAPDPNHNVLFILEAGTAPTKIGKGEHNAALGYLPGPSIPDTLAVTFLASGESFTGGLAENLHWQASTAGGRQVDQILAGKVVFKENASTIAKFGSVAAGVGTSVFTEASRQGDSRLANIGGNLAVLGSVVDLFGRATAGATRTEADTRTWSNLPSAMFFATGALTLKPAEVTTAKVDGPSSLNGGTHVAPLQPIPGTQCHLARAVTGQEVLQWNRSNPGQWASVADLERKPVPARAEANDGRAADGPKAAPVRASF